MKTYDVKPSCDFRGYEWFMPWTVTQDGKPFVQMPTFEAAKRVAEVLNEDENAEIS